MTKLADVLLDPDNRSAVIADCSSVINQEVGDKKGLTGLAVKAAFKAVKTINPSIIESVIDVLLDDFVVQLEPTYQAFLDDEESNLERYCVANANAIANALLSITDKRAERSKIKALVKAYQKLRPQGQKHVQEAVPRIAQLLSKHGL